MKESYGKVTCIHTVDFLVIHGKSNRKVIENYLLLLGSVYYNYLLLEDFDYLLLITGYFFENRSITYYFSITYYLLPHVCCKLNRLKLIVIIRCGFYLFVNTSDILNGVHY